MAMANRNRGSGDASRRSAGQRSSFAGSQDERPSGKARRASRSSKDEAQEPPDPEAIKRAQEMRAGRRTQAMQRMAVGGGVDLTDMSKELVHGLSEDATPKARARVRAPARARSFGRPLSHSLDPLRARGERPTPHVEAHTSARARAALSPRAPRSKRWSAS